MKHERIEGAVFNRDESRILTWSEDGTARLWDAQTQTQVGPEMKHEGRRLGCGL